MDEATFKKQQPYAGQKKASMLRRAVWNDYTGRQVYMITLVTEGWSPLLGQVVGKSDAPNDSSEAPAIVPSNLGMKVEQEWWACADYHCEKQAITLQLMPDHLHGFLFVREKMEQPLGMVIRGFKQSCNRHYRELVLGQAATQAALPTGQPKRERRGEDRTHGQLFARGYNDRLLLRQGQMECWRNYLADNPRRLLMKREHPDLFRVQRNVVVGPYTFSAIGNSCWTALNCYPYSAQEA